MNTPLLAKARFEDIRGFMERATERLIADDFDSVARLCQEGLERIEALELRFAQDWLSLDLVTARLTVTDAWMVRRRRSHFRPAIEELRRRAVELRLRWLQGED